jgi:hypothetical protein
MGTRRAQDDHLGPDSAQLERLVQPHPAEHGGFVGVEAVERAVVIHAERVDQPVETRDSGRQRQRGREDEQTITNGAEPVDRCGHRQNWK